MEACQPQLETELFIWLVQVERGFPLQDIPVIEHRIWSPCLYLVWLNSVRTKCRVSAMPEIPFAGSWEILPSK